MKNRTFKILSLGAFGTVMLLAGVFLVNMVGAQTSQTPDCNTGSSGFWGYVACWIGSPSQGISGADTLFKGQKALSDKIAAIPGGSGGGGGSNSMPQVYIERKDAGGNLESIRLGQIFQGSIKASLQTWGLENCTTVGGTITIGNTSCPELSLTFANRVLTVMFNPDQTWADTHDAVLTIGAERLYPTLCYVKQGSGNYRANSLGEVQEVVVLCSYYPQASGVNVTAGKGNGGVKNVSVYDYGFNNKSNTPVAQMFRIRIK